MLAQTKAPTMDIADERQKLRTVCRLADNLFDSLRPISNNQDGYFGAGLAGGFHAGGFLLGLANTVCDH